MANILPGVQAAAVLSLPTLWDCAVCVVIGPARWERQPLLWCNCDGLLCATYLDSIEAAYHWLFVAGTFAEYTEPMQIYMAGRLRALHPVQDLPMEEPMMFLATQVRLVPPEAVARFLATTCQNRPLLSDFAEGQ